MIRAAVGGVSTAAAALFALSGSERWLLGSSVALFCAMVGYCTWIAVRVSAASEQANEANRKATALDKRTAAIEERLATKE